MITEDYCSYEVAKLLKEKGFNEPCRAYWDDQPKLDMHTLFFSVEPIRNSRLIVNDVSCPTHQMVIKWLREVHKVNIEIHYNRFGENYKYLIIYKPEVLDDIHSLGVYFHYEEAVEVALKYSLENLI